MEEKRQGFDGPRDSIFSLSELGFRQKMPLPILEMTFGFFAPHGGLGPEIYRA